MKRAALIQKGIRKEHHRLERLADKLMDQIGRLNDRLARVVEKEKSLRKKCKHPRMPKEGIYIPLGQGHRMLEFICPDCGFLRSSW
jgi:hypothetical protein